MRVAYSIQVRFLFEKLLWKRAMKKPAESDPQRKAYLISHSRKDWINSIKLHFEVACSLIDDLLYVQSSL